MNLACSPGPENTTQQDVQFHIFQQRNQKKTKKQYFWPGSVRVCSKHPSEKSPSLPVALLVSNGLIKRRGGTRVLRVVSIQCAESLLENKQLSGSISAISEQSAPSLQLGELLRLVLSPVSRPTVSVMTRNSPNWATDLLLLCCQVS